VIGRAAAENNHKSTTLRSKDRQDEELGRVNYWCYLTPTPICRDYATSGLIWRDLLQLR
jgi:hypothetical protein